MLGILLTFISSTAIDFLPSRHAVTVTDHRYELLDWLSRAAAVTLIVAFLLWLRALWRSPSRGPLFVGFIGVGMALFLFANFGAILYAKSLAFGAQWSDSLREVLLNAINAPGTTVVLAAPFLLLALIAAVVARSGRIAAGTILFIVGITVLGWIYLAGYIDSQAALAERKWTTSAFTLGFVPLKSLLLLAALYLFSLILTRANFK